MKKVLTGVVVAAIGAVVVAVIKLTQKKEKEVEFIEIDESIVVNVPMRFHDVYTYCPLELIDSLRQECKLKMESLVDVEKVVLRHFISFPTQDDLFSSVKEIKGLEYMLEEVSEDRSVVLRKVVNNYFEDVYAQLCEVANTARKYNGDYQGFKLQSESSE